MKTITFTAIEAEVLEHRLSHLAGLGDDDLAELFPGMVDLDFQLNLTGLASQFIGAVQRGSGVAFTSSVQCVPAILAEALEGSTFHEMASEAQGAGAITPQKRAAYRKAMQSAAGKIGAIAGREIELP